MSSQRSLIVPWTRDELGQMVAWMEDNQELLRGKQAAWHKDIKAQVFGNDNHITLKKIKEKAANMKRAWKDAKAMQELSGWGLKFEDNEPSINDRLEQKSGFFWRLEEICMRALT